MERIVWIQQVEQLWSRCRKCGIPPATRNLPSQLILLRTEILLSSVLHSACRILYVFQRKWHRWRTDKKLLLHGLSTTHSPSPVAPTAAHRPLLSSAIQMLVWVLLLIFLLRFSLLILNESAYQK